VSGGALFRAEIEEQPQALLRLLAHDAEFAAVARALDGRDAVRLVGHGSSDNAASFGVYAFGVLCGLTAFRDSISLAVYYDAKVDVSRSAVLALSQSGRTPDVLEYVSRAKARGAYTVAITNDPESELADAAHATLPLEAGPERSVAATKTYLNQLAALALLASKLSGNGFALSDGIERTAALLDESIPSLAEAASVLANAFAFAARMFVIGRGLEFATARETALKLTETCRVAAEPLTATDLAHGPVAALDQLFPVWTIASHDAALPAVVEAASRALEAGATLVACGNAAHEIRGASYLPVPRAPHEVLAPLLSVVPGQLFAGALAAAKGLDPDRPHGLSKVTLAR
jgi:glucosamine--fructose-6-phosphate aminotransferase (isomerizing)